MFLYSLGERVSIIEEYCIYRFINFRNFLLKKKEEILRVLDSTLLDKILALIE